LIRDRHGDWRFPLSYSKPFDWIGRDKQDLIVAINGALGSSSISVRFCNGGLVWRRVIGRRLMILNC